MTVTADYRGHRAPAGPPAALTPPASLQHGQRPAAPGFHGARSSSLYLLFIIGPAIYMVVMSFFDTSLVKPGPAAFAGLRQLPARR